MSTVGAPALPRVFRAALVDDLGLPSLVVKPLWGWLVHSPSPAHQAFVAATARVEGLIRLRD